MADEIGTDANGTDANGTGAESWRIRIRRATAADAAPIAEVYLASRADALPGLPVLHTDDEVRHWIAAHLLRQAEAWIAAAEAGAVGFMALQGDMVAQLYLRPGWHRQGIGSRLLALAKRRRPAGLRLYTFQRNLPARAFYEALGFQAAAFSDGAGNEEREPDILYAWSPG